MELNEESKGKRKREENSAEDPGSDISRTFTSLSTPCSCPRPSSCPQFPLFLFVFCYLDCKTLQVLTSLLFNKSCSLSAEPKRARVSDETSSKPSANANEGRVR